MTSMLPLLNPNTILMHSTLDWFKHVLGMCDLNYNVIRMLSYVMQITFLQATLNSSEFEFQL